MPCLRPSSVAEVPASSSLRIATIWLSVKRLFFTVGVSLAGLYAQKLTVSVCPKSLPQVKHALTYT